MENSRKAAPPGGAHTSFDGRDFYRIADVLDAHERSIVDRVRLLMESEVAPIINDYWAKAKFPFELVPKLRALGIAGTSFEGFGCPGGSNVLNGFICMEMARVDPSIATFFGVHSGLAMGSIYLCGSDEQRQRWLPAMARLGQDRRLRIDGAGCGIRRCWRIDDNRAAGGRPLAPEWSEEMDRKRHICGFDRDLGARRSDQPG